MATLVAAGLTGALLLGGSGLASADETPAQPDPATSSAATPAQENVIPTAVHSRTTGTCVGSDPAPSVSTEPAAVHAVGCTVADLDYWAEANAPLPLGVNYTYATPQLPPDWVGARGPMNLVNTGTGWCLDSNTEGNVYAKPCQPGNEWQQWDVFTLSGGDELATTVVLYRNRATQRALEITPEGDVGTEVLDTESHNPGQEFDLAFS
jgi:hypothetical protein